MDLRCPKCNSTDLKKVSLAYEEGVYRTNARTRLSAAVVGGNGPDLVVGRTTTRGTQQSALSKVLTRPKKWPYLKLLRWSVLVFVSIGWIVFYVNTVTRSGSSVASVPLAIYAVLSACLFVVLSFLYWKHNHSTYPRQYAQWNRSFMCQRCGAVSQHNP